MTASCNVNLHTTRTGVWTGRRAQNTLSFSLSQLNTRIHTPKTLHRFLNFTCKGREGAAALGGQEKIWGTLTLGALRQRAHAIGAACTNAKLYGLTKSQDLWLPITMPMTMATAAFPGPTTIAARCLAKATAETLCYIPPKLLANSRNAYQNWSKARKQAIS